MRSDTVLTVEVKYFKNVFGMALDVSPTPAGTITDTAGTSAAGGTEPEVGFSLLCLEYTVV